MSQQPRDPITGEFLPNNAKGRSKRALRSVLLFLSTLRGQLPVTMKESQGEFNGPLSTFPEWHAFEWGIGTGAMIALAMAHSEAATTLVSLQALRMLYFAHTGRRLEIGGKSLGLPDRYLGQIRREPHYFDVGVVGGVGLIVATELYFVGHPVVVAF